jgi:hypothetical protein
MHKHVFLSGLWLLLLVLVLVLLLVLLLLLLLLSQRTPSSGQPLNPLPTTVRLAWLCW